MVWKAVKFSSFNCSNSFASFLSNLAVNADVARLKFVKKPCRILEKQMKEKSSVSVVATLRSFIATVVRLATSSRPGRLTCPRQSILFLNRATFQLWCLSRFFEKPEKRLSMVNILAWCSQKDYDAVRINNRKPPFHWGQYDVHGTLDSDEGVLYTDDMSVDW